MMLSAETTFEQLIEELIKEKIRTKQALLRTHMWRNHEAILKRQLHYYQSELFKLRNK